MWSSLCACVWVGARVRVCVALGLKEEVYLGRHGINIFSLSRIQFKISLRDT